MHHDYRGGHHLSQSRPRGSAASTVAPKRSVPPLFSCHVAFRLFPSALLLCVRACVCVFFLFGALEWHFILFAFCSAVNSNVNGLARNPLSEEWEGGRNLGITSGRARGMNWGFSGGSSRSSCSPHSAQESARTCPLLALPSFSLALSRIQYSFLSSFCDLLSQHLCIASSSRCLVQVNE